MARLLQTAIPSSYLYEKWSTAAPTNFGEYLAHYTQDMILGRTLGGAPTCCLPRE